MESGLEIKLKWVGFVINLWFCKFLLMLIFGLAKIDSPSKRVHKSIYGESKTLIGQNNAKEKYKK